MSKLINLEFPIWISNRPIPCQTGMGSLTVVRLIRLRSVMASKDSSDTSRRKRTQTNPKSLANLTHEGRPQAYDQPKKNRSLSVTMEGWEGFQALAEAIGVSTSEFVELQGRGKINLRTKIKDLSSNEALAQLNVTPAQLMEMSLLEVLVRLSATKQAS